MGGGSALGWIHPAPLWICPRPPTGSIPTHIQEVVQQRWVLVDDQLLHLGTEGHSGDARTWQGGAPSQRVQDAATSSPA